MKSKAPPTTTPAALVGARRLLGVAFGLLATALNGQAETHLHPAQTNLELHATAQATSEGVFLSDLIQCDPASPMVRLCDAPAFGKTTILTRDQVSELLRNAKVDLAATNWTGPETVKLSRRARVLAETEALDLLTATLQTESIKERGTLELRFSRPWTPLSVPDEPFKLRILDLPTSGVSAMFIVRFELETEHGEHVGSWQAAVQARVWREVWVASDNLKRGVSLRAADVARERRDILNYREPLADFDRDDGSLEFAESVSAGMIIPARALKLRPVVRRGQSVMAQVRDGSLGISLKVEVMEDGAPGQVIRVRNPMSRRDLRGKVLDERNVLVLL